MQILTTGLAAPVALAAVALIGYVVGYYQRQRAAQDNSQLEVIHRKLERAES